MKWFRIIPVLLVFFVSNNALGNGTTEKNTMITRTKAIELANTEAKKLGYTLASLDLSVEPTPSDRANFLKRHPGYKDYKSVMTKLNGHRFWAIYFSPKSKTEIVLGGDLWIFIDAYNGKTLSVIRGK